MKRPLEIGRAMNPSNSRNVCNSCFVSTCRIHSSAYDCKHSYCMSDCGKPVDLITGNNKDTCCTTNNPIPNKVVGSSNVSSICSSFLDTCIYYLWHNRLGHVPFVKMRSISNIPMSFAPKQPFICTICPMAKQTKVLFPTSNRVSNKPFDILHLDLWGPYHVETHDHYKYFLTMVDDHNRSTWVHLLSCKSNTLQIIKSFVQLIETQFHVTIKAIRSDNGLEFTCNEASIFYHSKGIIHQKYCPYILQQNGVVERQHKYLLEVARSLMFQSKLPFRYWRECILTATYLINSLPSVILKNKCPYEILYEKNPHIPT